jgi:hypothetical protein
MGRKAFARFGSYAIVMHAVSAFSDALRQELVGTGIHVAVIYPALTATELLRDATVSEMPPPFRHMTPLSSEKVAAAVVSAVMRRQRRVVLPWQANMLLLGEALSPWFGDLIARALTVRFVARLLGMSSGQTYHDTLARRSLARGAFLVAAAVTGAATMLPTPPRAADVMAHMNVVSVRRARGADARDSVWRHADMNQGATNNLVDPRSVLRFISGWQVIATFAPSLGLHRRA